MDVACPGIEVCGIFDLASIVHEVWAFELWEDARDRLSADVGAGRQSRERRTL